MHEQAYALRLINLSMQFGPVHAVSDVTLDIRRGHVHALLGENGAGKSTIVKLLSGLITPTQGSIEVFGRSGVLRSPRHAHALGIQTAFQEMTMLPELTVLDNMLLPHAERGPSGMLRRRELRQRIEQHFNELEFEIELDMPVRELDLALQQKIEIARAIFREPEILLLDEPTSTLSSSDVDWLGGIIARLKQQGVTIIFISHRMKEVDEFCDDLSILRNGKHVSTRPVQDYTHDEVVELIVGRSISQVFPVKDIAVRDNAVLELEGVSSGLAQGVDLQLHQGEILGIAALQGMGQLDVFETCFGLRQPQQGRLLLDGKEITFLSPKDAIQPSIGIGFVPEDRKTEGLLLNQSGLNNAALPVLRQFKRGLALNSRKEVNAAATVFKRINLHERALWMDAGSFSGGNQQKIVIAKWLLAKSRILLLFDPTRGIDVGTKQELYALMADFVKLGGAILFYSTEIPEVVNMSHRIHVMYKGRIGVTLEHESISETRVMEAAMGQFHTLREDADG